jgi:epoxyqueuosine reductase
VSAPDLAERVKGVARALGFDAVGVAPAEPSSRTRFLSEWLGRGYAGEMGFLARRVREREDPRLVLAGARSVIAVALVYGRAEEPPAAAPAAAAIARYARGDDYHEVLGSRLRTLVGALAPLAGRPVRARSYVDTGPVLERAHAARAGLGWIGKNTCLIHPELGSWLFLGTVLTDLALAPDAPEPDHCGSCRACLDACPTGAFPEPYVLDATRCLAYTTIELPEDAAIPEALREGQGDWVFGCDVCQEVCPWNGRAARHPEPASAASAALRERFVPRPALETATLAWLLELDEEAWRAATQRTALRRAKRRGLLRNALVAAGNRADPALRASVARHAGGDDALLADAARWALARIDAARAPGAGG